MKKSPAATWLENRGQQFVEKAVVPLRTHLPKCFHWWLTANGISTLRLMFTLPVHLCAFAGLLLGAQKLVFAALVLFVPTALLDLLDGWIARHDNDATALGGFLDSTGDKWLILPLLAFMLWRWKFPFFAIEVCVWTLIAVDTLNLVANTISFMRAISRAAKNDAGVQARALSTLFANYAGKVKLWTQAIVCGVFFFCVSAPEYAGFLPEFLNFVAIPVALLSACASFVLKMRLATATATGAQA